MGHIIRTLGALLCATSFGVTAAAQDAPSNPVMTAVDYFSAQGVQQQPLDLRIEQFDINVQIAAGYAETTAVISFRNPTDDQLEGQFVLNLPEDARVTGYGIDIEGRMIPGVIVEAKKARKAFEQRIRERVDPGLGEVTRDNAFKNRVFPINPGDTRTVSVTFTSPVSEQSPYKLPLKVDTEIRQFSVRVNGGRLEGLESLNLSRAPQYLDDGLVTKDVTLSGTLTVTTVGDNNSGSIQKHPSGDHFVSLILPEPDTQAIKGVKTVRIYWDASLSHQNGIELERTAISRALNLYAPEHVGIVSFSNGAAVERLYANTVADAGARLGSLHRNGGTNLEKLFDGEMGRTGADVCILVSDGRNTIGKMPDQTLPCRLYTLSGASDADRGALTLLARRGGGRFIDAAQTDGSDLWLRPSAKLSALRVGGRSILEHAEWTSDGNVMRILARVEAAVKSVSVQTGSEVERISLTPLEEGDMLGTVWAGQKLETLRASGADWEDRVAMAQKYGVAGEEGSFLVLETIEDYVEQRIGLPRFGFGEAERDAFVQLLEEALQQDARAREDRLTTVVEAWEDLLKWYRADHKLLAHSKLATATEDQVYDETDAAPRALPPPPPPPSPSLVAEEPHLETVTVTATARASGTNSNDMGPREEISDASPASVTVEIREWSPDRPYLAAVNGMCADTFFAEYLKQREGYGDLPGFYLEMADAASKCEEDRLATDIVLSALELPAANLDTVTAVANRLMSYEAYDEAIDLYRRVVAEDASRPQPWRDLALALEIHAMKRGTSRGQRREILSEALDHLAHVIETPWNGDYDGIELISVIEANRIRDRLMGVGGEGQALDRRLRQSMKFDIRVTATWNVDSVDMDLWVNEPTGERTYYGNQNSQIGGRLSNDMTDGYGPEEYLIRQAAPGKYVIRMHYYRSDIVNPNGAVTLRAHIFRNWGTYKQSMETVDLEFTSDDENEYLVAVVEVGSAQLN